MTIESLIEIAEKAALVRFGPKPPVTIAALLSPGRDVVVVRVDYADADGELWSHPILVSGDEVAKNSAAGAVSLAGLRSRMVMDAVARHLGV